MDKILILLAFVGFACAENEAKRFCTDGFTHFESHCYKILSETTGVSWIDAIHECQKSSAILAEPSNEEVSEFLREFMLLHHELLGQNEWFLGLSDMYVERKWIIPSTGLEPNFTLWQDGSPSLDHLNLQDCAVMIFSDDDVKWKDVSCTDHKGNYSDPVLPVCQKPRCPEDFLDYGSHCYYLINSTVSWEDAELACLNYGGNLVSIHSKEENDFIFSLAKTKKASCWIGAVMTGTDSDSFRWTDGSPVDFTNWQNGYPSAGQGVYMAYQNGLWLDNSGESLLYPICKI